MSGLNDKLRDVAMNAIVEYCDTGPHEGLYRVKLRGTAYLTADEVNDLHSRILGPVDKELYP